MYQTNFAKLTNNIKIHKKESLFEVSICCLCRATVLQHCITHFKDSKIEDQCLFVKRTNVSGNNIEHVNKLQI